MITEAIIIRKLDRSVNDLETSPRMNGEVVESLSLYLGDTTLSRIVNQDGSKGEIGISTQESRDPLGLNVEYARYKIIDGKLVTDPDYYDGYPERISPYSRLKLLAKVAMSRPDHWAEEDGDIDWDEYEIGG